MRFLVDQCVDVSVNAWLRDRGHDSIHLRDQQLQRLPNGKIFEKAAAEQRVIVTIDLDFGEIMSLSGTLVVMPILERGAIVIVEDARFRVRQLPF